MTSNEGSEESSSENMDVDEEDSEQDKTRQNQFQNQKSEPVKKLQDECAKRAHLDQQFYTIVYNKSNNDGSILVAKCTACEKVLRGSAKVSSNFITHLRKQHPQQYELFLKKKQQMNKVAPLNRDRYRCSPELFETNIINYILGSFAPLSTVDHPGFRRIFDDLKVTKGKRKYLVIPDRTALSRRIDARFAAKMSELKVTLQGLKYISTTADIWSTNKRSFLGVTAHWIDPETLTRSFAAIACRRFPGSHTYSAVAASLDGIHKYFMDLKCLVGTVTDNAANYVKAFKEFGLKDLILTDLDVENEDVSDFLNPDEDLENFDDEDNITLPNHLRCSTHTLNLICTTDFRKVIGANQELENRHMTALSRCTILWNKHRSPKQTEIILKHLGIALKRPELTRWNSTFAAIDCIRKVKEKLSSEFYRDLGIEEQNRLQKKDFDYLREYCVCLKPVVETLDYLQGESYAYYGILIPSIVSLKFKLRALLKANLKYSQLIIQGLLESLQSRYKHLFEITGEGENAAIAAALHPRFKLDWLSNFPPELKEKVQELVYKAPRGMGLDYQDVPVPAKNSFFLYNDEAPTMETESEVVPQSTVLEEYLKSPTTIDLNVIQQDKVILELFLKYNTPLPSSAAVERVFSTSIQLNVAKYNRLSDKHFEIRTLFKANKQFL